MFAGNKESFTVLNDPAGRYQEKAVAFAKLQFGDKFPYLITEPGIHTILAGRNSRALQICPNLVEYIKYKARISAEIFGSTQCIIFGQWDDVGNTVPYEDHVQHLQESCTTIASWNLFEEIRAVLFTEDLKPILFATRKIPRDS